MNHTLTAETQKCLEDIRGLVEKKDVSTLRQDANLLKLSEVYIEVMAFSGFKVGPIQASCPSCINEPVNVVYNYITHHEQRQGDKDAVIVEFAGGKPVEVDEVYEKFIADKEAGLFDPKEPSNTIKRHEYDTNGLEYYVMDYKELLALAKEKGYKGGRIPKKELIEFLTKE